MSTKEEILVQTFEKIKKHDDLVTNREVFYIMNNHKDNKFKDQEECDNILAKLISENKIDKKFLVEDDFFKFNKSLEKVING